MVKFKDNLFEDFIFKNCNPHIKGVVSIEIKLKLK
jgi:hypothetical protein